MQKNLIFLGLCCTIGGISAFMTQGCLKNQLDPLPFFEVFTRSPQAGLERIVLRGEVAGLDQNMAAATFGFVVNSDLEAIQADLPAGQKLSAPLLSGGNFEVVYTALQPQTILYYRAFVQLDKRTVYGKVQLYQLGDIVQAQTVRISNDSAFMEGHIVGLKVTADTLLEYGHVYSFSNPNPEPGLPGCLSTQLGKTAVDIPFQSRVGGLNLNTTYYVRAYGKGKTKTFLSPVQTFRVRDGWKRMADLPPQQQAVAIAAGGKAYWGFGCDATTNCLQTSLPNDFWAYTPRDTNGVWAKTASCDPFFARTSVAAFTIGDTVYVVTGEYYDPISLSGKPFFVFDFLKFDLKTQTWSEGELNLDIKNRSGAVAFALQGKGYLGAGEGSDETKTFFYNDFWEYNPANARWRKVASLPLKENPSNPTRYTEGRAEAVAFTIGQYAYAGAGRVGFFTLKDFWRFTPPVSPVDTGSWQQIRYLPGVARYDAVAFATGNKGYCGLGHNVTEGEFSDFWEYDPAADTWKSRTPFPPGSRSGAVGFALGNYGYAGTGTGRVPLPPLFINFKFQLYGDIWRYEPEQ